MNLPEVLQKLDAGSIVTLYRVDTRGIGGTDVFNFHAGTDVGGQNIVWQGVTYVRFPVEADGFELNTRGTLPRPRMKVANIEGVMYTVLREHEDLVGATVTRKRTFARFLDGQPTADWTQQFPDDVYFVERKVSENQIYIELELASVLDFEDVKLPRRQIIAGMCSWQYRSAECSYAGSSYYDADGGVVGTIQQDVCAKTVPACKLRFGSNGILPYGGFPAARVYSI